LKSLVMNLIWVIHFGEIMYLKLIDYKISKNIYRYHYRELIENKTK